MNPGSGFHRNGPAAAIESGRCIDRLSSQPEAAIFDLTRCWRKQANCFRWTPAACSGPTGIGAQIDRNPQDIKHAQADLAAVAQIVGLAVTQDLTPYNACHVARVARYATDQASTRLKHVEDALDH
jgi:hypothetical protein